MLIVVVFGTSLLVINGGIHIAVRKKIVFVFKQTIVALKARYLRCEKGVFIE